MGQNNVLQSTRKIRSNKKEAWNNPASFKKYIIKNGELWWGKNANVQFHPIDIYYNSLLHPLHDEITEDLISV